MSFSRDRGWAYFLLKNKIDDVIIKLLAIDEHTAHYWKQRHIDVRLRIFAFDAS
jgi:hypothetical protein